MLDKQDLQAIQEMITSSEERMKSYIDGSVTASEERTQAKLDELDAKIGGVESRLQERIDSVESRLETRIDSVESRLETRIDSVESRLDAKIGGVESRLDAKIGGVESHLDAKIDNVDSRWQVYVENRIEPNFQLLAEGHQTLLDTLAPRNRVDKLEEDVTLLKSVVNTLVDRMSELEKAQ